MNAPLCALGALTFASLATAAPQTCDVTGLDNPYSNDVYGLAEWQGYYYDGGWFHLRRRPVSGGTWETFGGGISGGGAYTLAAPMKAHGGRLIIGGAFFTAGPHLVNNICAWDGTSFAPLDSGLNGEVSEIVIWNGQIVAGGEFTANGSGSLALDHVAIYDEQLDTWKPLGAGLGNLPSGYSSAIWGLTVHEGDLYATGRFRSSGATQLNGVARWQPGTSSWEPLGSGIPNMVNGNVGTAIGSYGSLLWVSGWFQSIGGVSAPWMATWDGSGWSPAPPGPTRHCLNFTVHQGELYGSGPFPFTLGGTEYDVARYDGVAWAPVGNTDSNWPNDVASNENGTALLVGGYFSGFNGVFTGNSLLLDCSAELGANYCLSGANGAVIAATGSESVAANDLTLVASGVPVNQFGIFYYGDTQLQLPFGLGFRCVGGTNGIFRLGPPINSGSGGEIVRAVDLTSPPHASGQILPGSTWNFQGWFRSGTTFDLTDGVSISFVP